MLTCNLCTLLYRQGERAVSSTDKDRQFALLLLIRLVQANSAFIGGKPGQSRLI